MDLKLLIYSKCFDNYIQQELLKIADSSMWVEDLIDLIGELANENKYCHEDCDYFTESQKEYLDFQKQINEIIAKVIEEYQDIDFEGDAEFDKVGKVIISKDLLVSKLSQIINALVSKKMDLNERTAKIGGIECPVDTGSVCLK